MFGHRVYQILEILKVLCSSNKRYVYFLVIILLAYGVYQSVLQTPESLSNAPAACTARHRVAFIKTHKTAGSTVTNIVQRFGKKRGLRFLLPEPSKNYLWSDRRAGLKITNSETFDLFCSHAVYNKTAMSKLLKPGTVFFTILRHPVTQFLSAFSYYRKVYKSPYLLMIPGEDPLKTFLLNPEKYESVIELQSYTNNRMSFDLGIAPSAFKDANIMDSYIRQIDKDFTLVMLMEYFDESIVLLRRRFCWELEDIVYVKLNVQSLNGYRINRELFELITKWQSADLRLYEYFYRRFWKEIGKQGSDFWEELEAFQTIEVQISNFCLGFNSSSSSSSSRTTIKTGQHVFLTVPKTRWNKEFIFSHSKCRLLRLNEVSFTNELRRLQQK